MMKESFEPDIRPAQLQETKVIRKLAEEIWPSSYVDILSAEQIHYMLDLFYSEESLAKQFRTHHFLLARLNEIPVGFASFSETETLGDAKLHKLYVTPQTQGSGIGKKLLFAVMEAARLRGSTSLLLNVNRQNRAIGFYEKNGFTKLREEDIDIGHGFWMNDFVMVRQL